MAQKGERRIPLPQSAGEPEGIYVWMQRYMQWLRVRNYSERTCINREKYIERFLHWSEGRGLTRPVQVTKPVLDRYQKYLFHLRKADGKPLTFRAQESHLVALRAYFSWLTKQNVLLSNPASDIELPRQEKKLPRHVLSLEETEAVLEQPDTDDIFGLRDRAILETLFSTGMRRGEIVRLGTHDIDQSRGTVRVLGKGKKERTVPIGEQALVWIDKYLLESRPELSTEPDDGTLFLTHFGEAFVPESLTNRVREYVRAADIEKTGSCHLFRHTAATLMLEAGADIRYIQEMLGHVRLGTTEIYTRVSILQLKKVHAATHPTAHVCRGIRKVSTDERRRQGEEGNKTAVVGPRSRSC